MTASRAPLTDIPTSGPTHLALPLRLTVDGSMAALAQDSDDEITASVGLLLATRPGERAAVPTYGIPDPTFAGIDAAAILAATAEWEPRADLALTADAVTATGEQYATAAVGIRDLTPEQL
jgi:phage baseplate assembly protein W